MQYSIDFLFINLFSIWSLNVSLIHMYFISVVHSIVCPQYHRSGRFFSGMIFLCENNVCIWYSCIDQYIGTIYQQVTNHQFRNPNLNTCNWTIFSFHKKRLMPCAITKLQNSESFLSVTWVCFGKQLSKSYL